MHMQIRRSQTPLRYRLFLMHNADLEHSTNYCFQDEAQFSEMQRTLVIARDCNTRQYQVRMSVIIGGHTTIQLSSSLVHSEYHRAQ